jgi:hypothetical protein
MVTVNTVDKYIDLYAVYKKSLAETKHLEYCLQRLEYNLVTEDLKKLSPVIHKSDLDRLRRRTESRDRPDLPWL